MSEIKITDTCPHCGLTTIVYSENEEGVRKFSGCQHCNKTLGHLPWETKHWFAGRILKPKRDDEIGHSG